MYICMYVCMSVCMSVCNGFTHSLRTFLARYAHDAIAMEVKVEDSEDRRRRQNKSRDIEDG